MLCYFSGDLALMLPPCLAACSSSTFNPKIPFVKVDLPLPVFPVRRIEIDLAGVVDSISVSTASIFRLDFGDKKAAAFRIASYCSISVTTASILRLDFGDKKSAALRISSYTAAFLSVLLCHP